MDALVFVGGSDGVQLQKCPIPSIVDPKHALVKVKGAGICGTDLRVINGSFPMPLNAIIGHEASGQVEEVGPECTLVKPGDRVGINPVKGCDNCRLCSRGRPNLCKKGGLSFYMGLSHVNGALTDYVVMPEELLVKLPDELSFEKAVLCETMSTVIRGCDLMEPLDEESKILILGGGITGMLAASYLTDDGYTGFTICQRSAARQENLRKQCAGFNVEVVGPDELEKAYQDSLNDDDSDFGFDAVFESTGNTAAVQNCLNYIKPGGKLVIFGCCPSHEKMEVSPFDVFFKELTICGSVIQPNTYERAVEKIVSLNRNNRLDFDILKVKTCALKDYREALKELTSKSITKAIIV